MATYKYQITARVDGQETLPALRGSAITGVTADAGFPTAMSKVGHGLNNGDIVYAYDFNEATYLNDKQFVVTSVSGGGFQLGGFDSTGEVSETTGGKLRRAFLQYTAAEELDEDNYITVMWGAVAGATTYLVYKFFEGSYSFLAETSSFEYKDDGSVIPNTTKAPPSRDALGLQSNPATGTYFQQRRIFGGGILEPDSFVASKIAEYDNFSYTGEVRADSPIKASIASGRVTGIKHLVSGRDLVILTGDSEWMARPGDDSGFTAQSIQVRPQSRIGSSDVQPLFIEGRVVFERRNGGGLYAIQYSWDSDGYQNEELSLFSRHLFQRKKIVELAQSFSPENFIVAVMDDGTANIMSYYPQQDVLAWTWIETDGAFESVTSVPNVTTGEDDIYFVVKRNVVVGGTTYQTRYIEVLDPRHITGINSAFFVDSGLSYSGTATRTVGGLYHLRGRQVVALADGGVEKNLTVSSSGTITLSQAARNIVVGLPYETEIETLNPENPQSTAQGTFKRVSTVFLQFYRSRGFKAGVKGGTLTEAKRPVEDSEALFSGQREVNLTTNWDTDASIVIKQEDPLPLSLQALIPYVDMEEKDD